MLCLDCRVDTVKIGEWYTVHDAIWLRAMPSYYGILCLRCLSRWLGRPLRKADFAATPAARLCRIFKTF